MDNKIHHPQIIGSLNEIPGSNISTFCDISDYKVQNPSISGARAYMSRNCPAGLQSTDKPWKIGYCGNDGSLRSWNAKTTQVDCDLLPDTLHAKKTVENYKIKNDCFVGVL